MGSAGRSWVWRALPLVFATAVMLIAWWPALMGERAPAGDGRGWFLPHFVLLADHIRQGQLLSWDPWTAGGVPVFTEPQAGAYSPITLLFGWITGGSLPGYNAYTFSLAWLAMVGMFLLARICRVRPAGATVLALGYAGCGVFIGQPHLSHHIAMAVVPWVLWRLEAYLRTGRRMPLLQAGALGGLAGLSAHPAALLYCALFSGWYFLGRLLLRSSGPRRNMPWSGRGWIVTVPLLAVVIVAPVYILFRTEGTGVHTRTEPVSREMAQAVSLHPGALSSIVNPATPVAQLLDSTLWPGGDAGLASLYSGILPLLLATVCIILRPRKAWPWWLGGCGVLFLILAMGKHLPLHGAVYDAIPPLRLLRHAAIFRIGWILSVAMLAIQGMRMIRCIGFRRPLRLGASAVPLPFATAVVVLGWLYVLPITRGLPRAEVAIIQLFLWALAGATLALALFFPRQGYRGAMLVLVPLAALDYMTSYQLSSRLMFDVDRRYIPSLLVRHSPSLELATWEREAGTRGNMSTVTVTRRPALIAHTTMKNGYLRPFATCAPLRQMAVGDQRVWFCANPPQRPATPQTFAGLVHFAQYSGQPLLVLHSPESMQSPAPPAQFALAEEDVSLASGAGDPALQQGVAHPIPAMLLEYRPQVLRFAVECPEDGWLMVTDRWSAGWRATVNGRAAEVWGADLLFRAVQVGKGQNEIVFTYQPAMRYPLLVLSWATLGAVGLATLAAAVHGRFGTRQSARYTET